MNRVDEIRNRLIECNYDVENCVLMDYIDDIEDLLYKYKLSIEEVEDMLLYDDYEGKRYTCDIDDGIHMEEEE